MRKLLLLLAGLSTVLPSLLVAQPVMYAHYINVGQADATLFDFGVLSSLMHMAWMRYVTGRLKSDYQYSVTIVYNNFPWPTPSDKDKEEIAAKAQTVLNAREQPC